MGFNERVHAYIAAKFYVRLLEDFGERGKKAFIHGTQYYAEQRGRRMAQRAIKDGRELNYGTYLEYGEWVNTQDVIKEGTANVSKIESVNPDYRLHVSMCPWYAQFRDMGLTEAGCTYCAHLDNSICRGFNPYLTYLVPETLHKDGHCTHIVKDVNFAPGETHPKIMKYVKGFDYHCAHSYWAYREVSEAIFGEDGKKTALKVLSDFTCDYGKEMADVIMSYEHHNFNVC